MAVKQKDNVYYNLLDNNGYQISVKIQNTFPNGVAFVDDDAKDNDIIYKFQDEQIGTGFAVKTFDVGQSKVLTVNNVNDIRNISKSNIMMFKLGVYTSIQTLGYFNPNDGGGFEYLYNPISSNIDDGFLFIKPNIISIGRFVPNIKNEIDVKIAGTGGANGTEDCYTILQKIFDYADGKGFHIKLSKKQGDYNITETLKIGSDTDLSFYGSYIKLLDYTTVGTLLMNKLGAKNITINNPLIDGNNVIAGGTGENGISFIQCRNCRVYGGVIKNCKKGTEAFKLGGKAMQVESYDIEDVIFDGVSVENCSWAMSSQYDIAANDNLGGTRVEVKYSNIIAKNCVNLAILHQMNGLVDSDKHLVELNNITSINCGNDDGLFVVSRLKGAKIDGLKIYGEPITGSLIRGRHSNCVLTNIQVSQNMLALIDLKPSFHGEATREATDNFYDFKLYSTVTYLLTSSSDNTYANRELRRSLINVLTNNDTFSICLSQAAMTSTNFNITSGGKSIFINSTDAVVRNRNTIASYTENINLGTSQKVKIGTVAPNSAVFGYSGDIYLQELNSYTNIYFKYFGMNTNTGWLNLAGINSGTTALRPTVTVIGFSYFDTTLGKPIWWNGTVWKDATGTTV